MRFGYARPKVDITTILTHLDIINIPGRIDGEEYGVAHVAAGIKGALVGDGPLNRDRFPRYGRRRSADGGDYQVGGGWHGDGDRPCCYVVAFCMLFVDIVSVVGF